MRFWVIVGEGGGLNEVRNLKSGFERLSEGESRNKIIPMDDLCFTMGEKGDVRIFIGDEEVPPPDVFMLWGHYNEVFDGISRRLTSLGARSINDIDAKRVVCSKLETALLLEKEGIPQAKSMTVTVRTPVEKIVEYIGLPAVFKPSDGAQGAGVVLLHTEEEIRDYLKTLKEGDGKAVLAQEYIATAKGKDTRVIVVNYKVAHTIQRIADDPDEFRSNVHLGGHRVPSTLDEDSVKLCEKVAEICGLRMCGIDLLETENGYVVGEVNCTPGVDPEFMKTDRFKQIIHDMIAETLRN